MERYWIWLSLLKLSERQKKMLAEAMPNPQELFCTVWGPDRLPQEFLEAVNNKDMTRAEAVLKECRSKGISVLGYHDEHYPPRLRGIVDPPVVLYCAGNPLRWEERPLIGVVGTRRLSGYGESNAVRMGKQIASCGGIVVSGGAAGVDALAMEGALRTGRPVVGVLGTGVDIYYPKANKGLLEKTREQGCLLSEYPPGTKAQPWQFPRRNRIISGISHGVLVVEAPEQSGALITAQQAREQGRDLYAVPGGVGLENAAGSNRLLQQGACAVLCGWDVMKDYASIFPTVEKAPGSTDIYQEDKALNVAQNPKIPNSGEEKFDGSDKKFIDKGKKSSYSIPIERLALSEEEALLCSHLSDVPRDADEVLLELEMPSGKALSILTKLTLTGVVENIPGQGVRLK